MDCAVLLRRGVVTPVIDQGLGILAHRIDPEARSVVRGEVEGVEGICRNEQVALVDDAELLGLAESAVGPVLFVGVAMIPFPGQRVGEPESLVDPVDRCAGEFPGRVVGSDEARRRTVINGDTGLCFGGRGPGLRYGQADGVDARRSVGVDWMLHGRCVAVPERP